MNGGGLVALLAFLQAIWGDTDSAVLIPSVLRGMMLLVIGLLRAGLATIFRFHASFAITEYKAHWKLLQITYFACWYLSLACFVMGASIVIYGAWKIVM